MDKNSTALSLAAKISEHFQRNPRVDAIALGGSQTRGILDQFSDIDLYIFTTGPVPLADREAIVGRLGASEANLNLTFWDPGDQWIDPETGIEVDVIYWDLAWIEGQIEAVLGAHRASMGCTTCFWGTILNAQVLYDRQGWFAKLQKKCAQPYPEPLLRAIVAKNHPVLRAAIPSYYAQIKKALTRGDLLSLNHRLAAFFASYFDILFALNRVVHPGEKKLMHYVKTQCTDVPPDLSRQVEGILKSGAAGSSSLLAQLDLLVDALDRLIHRAGMDLPRL